MSPVVIRHKLALAATFVLLLTACGAEGESSTTSQVITTTAADEATTLSTSPVETTTTTVPDVTTTTSITADVIIEGGGGSEIVVTGPDVFKFSIGDQVEITVLSSIEDEIHVHGYDLFYPTVPGEITAIAFLAEIRGIFEVELESGHVEIFSLEVS